MNYKKALGFLYKGYLVKSYRYEYLMIDGVIHWREIGGEEWNSMLNHNEVINKWEVMERESVSFEEAFKEYQKGNEIESVESGIRYKNGKLFYNDNNDWVEFNMITVEEISNKWYING